MDLHALSALFWRAVRFDPPPPEVATAIASTSTWGAHERVALYRRMYWYRQIEALRDSFPALVHVLGDEVYDKFPFLHGMTPMNPDLTELVLNRTWRPALSITGVDGIPPLASAGNVLRPFTSLKLSLRLPPTLDGKRGGDRGSTHGMILLGAVGPAKRGGIKALRGRRFPVGVPPRPPGCGRTPRRGGRRRW